MVEQKQSTELAPLSRLNSLFDGDGVKKAIEAKLKDRASTFISSVITLANTDSKFKTVKDPMTIVQAAMTAASLDLSINPSLGQAYIIPYSGKATFQIGWRGYVQLFLRSGQASGINAFHVREGDIKRKNRLSGEIELNDDEHPGSPVIGYMCWFKLLNGFEHALFMSVEDIDKHAKQYSASYRYDLENNSKASKWSTDKEPMALKTVVKLNLAKYAPLSIEMQKALEVDEAIDVEGKVVYPDNPPELLPSAEVIEPKTTSSKLKSVVNATVVKATDLMPDEPLTEEEGLLPI